MSSVKLLIFAVVFIASASAAPQWSNFVSSSSQSHHSPGYRPVTNTQTVHSSSRGSFDDDSVQHIVTGTRNGIPYQRAYNGAMPIMPGFQNFPGYSNFYQGFPGFNSNFHQGFPNQGFNNWQGK
jgi:hypothetical protein